MAKSIDDAISEARLLINDSTAPFRYSDAIMIFLLNTAMREVYTLRPDAFIGNFTQGVLVSNPITDFVLADLAQNPATPFPIDDRHFYAPVVLYIAGKAELSDDEFADDNRAMTILVAFRQNLTGQR